MHTVTPHRQHEDLTCRLQLQFRFGIVVGKCLFQNQRCTLLRPRGTAQQ